MKKTLGTLRLLQSTSSTNDKGRIVASNLNDELFVEIMQFLTNDYIQVGLSKKKIIKKVSKDTQNDVNGWNLLISGMLNYLKTHNTGKDSDILVCQQYLESNVDAEDRDFVSQILTKEVKLGATSTLWNKNVPKELQVPVFDVLLAKSYDDFVGKIDSELKRGFVITKKLDGLRCVAVIDNNGQVKFFTRQGKEYDGLIEIEQDIHKLGLIGMVLDGELLSDSEGSTNEVYAETSSKARNKDKNKTGLIYNVFEILPLDEFQNGKSKLNTIDRKELLHDLLNRGDLNFVKEVEMLYCGNDIPQIDYWTRYALDSQWEGCMLSLNKPYECKRSNSLLKIKKMLVGDCRCISVVEGDGKNKGKLGSIVIEFEHEGNLHRCECGSGFNDNERQLYFDKPELVEGKIVEIQYFEISKNQQGGVGLRFPVWLGRIREDKSEINMK